MTKKVALYLQDSHDLRDGLDIVRYAEEKGFDARKISQQDIDTYGLGD